MVARFLALRHNFVGHKLFVISFRKFLPSPVAFGIAFIVPGFYSISMWLGALLTHAVQKRNPEQVEKFSASLASGLIAGEGLMMVVIAILLIWGVSWV